jgi:hypothetical protein
VLPSLIGPLALRDNLRRTPNTPGGLWPAPATGRGLPQADCPHTCHSSQGGATAKGARPTSNVLLCGRSVTLMENVHGYDADQQGAGHDPQAHP